jgi:hypothetical protein
MVVEQYTAATETDKLANEQDNLMESKPEPAAGGMDTTTVHGELDRTAAVLLMLLPGLSAMCCRICSSLFTVRATLLLPRLTDDCSNFPVSLSR